MLNTKPIMETDVDTEILFNLMKKKRNMMEKQNLGDLRMVPREGTETIGPVVTTEETAPETLPGEKENHPEEDLEIIPEEEMAK